MKKVLITGADSYIGTNVGNYLINSSDGFHVDTIDMKDEGWREKAFGGYDVIFHVAGIAHADVGKLTEEKKNLYYSVNTRLAVEAANKAKAEGVKQFILMSSMIIYSGCSEKIITCSTVPRPDSVYGDSKWQADRQIRELGGDGFLVAVLRPPMIYGKGSKGNYIKLSKLAHKLPMFPKVKNRRSMLYVGNLCEFVRLIICDEASGVFFPQNREYSVTSDMVKKIASAGGKNIILVPGFNWLIKLLMKVPGRLGRLAKKAFGDYAYHMDMSEYKRDYRVAALDESIRLTEE